MLREKKKKSASGSSPLKPKRLSNMAGCTVRADSVPKTIIFGSNVDQMRRRQMEQGEMHGYNAFLKGEKRVEEPSRISCYKVSSNMAFLHVVHPCEFLLYGYLKVKCFQGTVHVYGTKLTTKSIEMYTVRDSHVFRFQTHECPEIRENLKYFLRFLPKHNLEQILNNFQPNDALLLVVDIGIPFSFSYLEGMNIGRSDFGFKQIQAGRNLSYIHDEDWAELPMMQRTMVIGAANVGKSTILKYLINRTLQSESQVVYLELDLGQTEFVPPGTLGLTVLEEPVLGPNFLHSRKCERMVHLGEIDVNKCSGNYIEAVEYLVGHINENYPGVTVIVNTMGFVKGLGVHLLKFCTKIIKPQLVLEVKSKEIQKNMNIPLQQLVGSQFPFYYHSVTSKAPSSAPSAKNKGKEGRNRMLISYFSRLLKSPHFSLNAVQPYCVDFKSIAIGVTTDLAKEDILRALNGGLVSLCEKPQPSDVLHQVVDDPDWFRIVVKPRVQACFGLGIVRGIDVEKRLIYIISPLRLSQMKQIGLICISNVTIPGIVFQKQEGVEGDVPYIADIDDDFAMLSVRRTQRPALARHGNPLA